MSTPQIVTLNVSQVQAPLPNKLQQSGLLISTGSTTLTVGTTATITMPSDLTAILSGTTLAITAISVSGTTATVTTASAHPFIPGEVGQVATILGAVPAALSGTFNILVPSTTTFAFAVPAGTGAATTPGTVVDSDQEIVSAVTTFFSQGYAVAVDVLELGPESTSTAGEAALATYLGLNQFVYYAVVLPKGWSGLTLLPLDEFLTAKIYFIITVNVNSMLSSYLSVYKDGIAVFQYGGTTSVGAGVLPSEFDAAAILYTIVSQQPSNVQKVPPFCYRYLYGVTQYPIRGNQAFLTSLGTQSINYVANAGEGGITNTMLYPGQTLDGRDFLYWYSVDWVEINIDLDLSNAIINGSNNQINPLYYDQNGIDQLRAVAQQTMNRAVTFGLALGPITVNAVPFVTYVQDNPSDFRTGVYKGLSVTYTPNRGFKSVTFNVVVTDFPAGGF